MKRIEKLILASGSPRRAELVKKLGIPFEICVPTCEEVLDPRFAVDAQCMQLARLKAFDVSAYENSIVLGSDTMVSFREAVLGKPRDGADAFRMLRTLSDQVCKVTTAYCLRDGSTGKSIENAVTCLVTFKPLSDTEIWDYIATGEPMDKAGAFAIQGQGRALIKDYSGDFDAIVGLPVAAVLGSLEKFIEC